MTIRTASRYDVTLGGASPTAEAAPGRFLVVDDDEGSRRGLTRVLRSLGYEVELARDGFEALAKLQLDIDLVVLDASMPGMDGFAVAQHIRQDSTHQDLPIIMVTGLNCREDRLRAVEVGVNDFVSKPFDVTELKLRSTWLLRMKQSTDALKHHRTELEANVVQRTAALRRSLENMASAERRTREAHLDTIHRLVLASEYKDHDTAKHIERIGRYSAFLAQKLNLAPGQVELIRHASPLHDVGKIGIPDAILLKPGKLTDGEWEVMKGHTAIGAQILKGAASEILRGGEMIALSHHERWDGTGYPSGLRGEDIPLEGRICAVADVFDALTTDRPYRDALPNETVYEMMQAESGKKFDPHLLGVFLAHRAEVERIQAEST
jgi:putative two-component system response regulator